VGDRVEDGDAFEALVGKRMVTRATFVHWGNENAFPADIGADVKAKGQVLTIFWEAMDYNGDPTAQPRFSYAAILRGDWDAYMQSFALDAKKYGGPIILIPFEEMNGDWYPWSGTENGNTAEEETRAYQHIHDMFTLVPNVKFGWDVNSDSVPDSAGNTLEDYYPGSAYVDYVGVDGFNDANPWMSFNDIFASTLSRLSVYRKPLFIFSFASAEGRAKPTWIESAMQSIKDTPLITGWIWFNENKEKNWLVNSDAASLQAFKNALP
jgi:beta-mannanase